MSENSLEFDYLGGMAPVQAEGTVAGHRFYFRSRYQRWTFSISEHADVSPVEIDSPARGAAYGFFREGEYGSTPFEASYMPEKEARRIIEGCATEYLRERSRT